jgi:hypothetical protein
MYDEIVRDDLPIAAKKARVAEPQFELSGFFKVMFKRS